MERPPTLLTAQGLEKLHATKQDIVNRLAELVKHQEAEEGERALLLSEIESLKTQLHELEYTLQYAKVVVSTNKHEVTLGSTVWLERADKSLTITVVDPLEADPGSGLISHASPLGQALMGKKPLDHLIVNTPTGTYEYSIKKIA